MNIGMLSLLILLTILILKADGRPPDNDLQNHQNLAYDHTYNNTHSALQQSFLRSYNRVKRLRQSDKYSYNDSRVNEVEERPFYDDPSDPLLVGFAGNPFGYSVPEDVYMKKFRDMDLQIYQNRTGNRDKRSIVQLYNMISCATDCDPISYNGYGCYCGLNGEGVSMDAIDSCCEAHDKCYDDINRPWYVVYLQPYFWQCNSGKPKCGEENDYKMFKFFFGSASKLCECDRKFAMCLRRYRCPKTRQVCHSSPRRQLQNEVMVFLMNLISKAIRTAVQRVV